MQKLAPVLFALSLVAFLAMMGIGWYVVQNYVLAADDGAQAAMLPGTPAEAGPTASATPSPTATEAATATATATITLTPSPTSTPPPSATPTSLPVPQFANPGFDEGIAPWVLSRSQIVHSAAVPPHSGDALMYLHDGERMWNNFRVSSFSQTIEVPADTQHAYLSFYFWARSNERVCNQTHFADALILAVNDEGQGLMVICMLDNFKEWRRATLELDFAQWAGETIKVEIGLTQDLGGSTDLYLDDIGFSPTLDETPTPE